jgi:hypothetical protein
MLKIGGKPNTTINVHIAYTGRYFEIATSTFSISDFLKFTLNKSMNIGKIY